MSRGSKRGRRWTRWSRADAEAVVGRLERSGLSLRGFCEGEGLNPERVRRWRARLRSSPPAPEPKGIELREVELIPGPRVSTLPGGVILERPDGVRLHLASGFDVESLRRALDVLDGGG